MTIKKLNVNANFDSIEKLAKRSLGQEFLYSLLKD